MPLELCCPGKLLPPPSTAPIYASARHRLVPVFCHALSTGQYISICTRFENYMFHILYEYRIFREIFFVANEYNFYRKPGKTNFVSVRKGNVDGIAYLNDIRLHDITCSYLVLLFFNRNDSKHLLSIGT